MRIADYLEMYDPKTYPPAERTQTICEINDILQERSDRPIASLLTELSAKLGEDKCVEIARNVQDFLLQQRMLNVPYVKSSSKQYKYRIFDPKAECPLKIVNQRLYDQAAKRGFPSDFFRQTYFDNVTFCCLPDNADLRFSHFADCTFAVCRIRETTFDGASLYSCEFHSCDMKYVMFFQATLANTHFNDCTMENVSFSRTRLKSCNTADCTMLSTSFNGATLDGCSYGRVQAFNTCGLHTARIAMGGATEREVEQNRKAIYAALRPESKERQIVPYKAKGAR